MVPSAGPILSRMLLLRNLPMDEQNGGINHSDSYVFLTQKGIALCAGPRSWCKLNMPISFLSAGDSQRSPTMRHQQRPTVRINQKEHNA